MANNVSPQGYYLTMQPIPNHPIWGDENVPTDRALPAGGQTGQALVKSSDADYDVEWAAVNGEQSKVPEGGTAGQVLTKATDENFDVVWKTIVIPEPPTPTNPLPTGGTSGQVLAKRTGTDYDVEWVTKEEEKEIPVGGTIGQVLAKTGTGDYEIGWKTLEEAQTPNVVGIPEGGKTGQVLAKSSDTNYEVEWVTQETVQPPEPELPEGGEAGQVLTKTIDGVAWVTPVEPEPELPSGGTDGQVLTKTASGVVWSDLPEPPSEIPEGAEVGQVLTWTALGVGWETPVEPEPELPAGGTEGQVLTKTANGVAWSTPQTGGNGGIKFSQEYNFTSKPTYIDGLDYRKGYKPRVDDLTPEDKKLAIGKKLKGITFNNAYGIRGTCWFTSYFTDEAGPYLVYESKNATFIDYKGNAIGCDLNVAIPMFASRNPDIIFSNTKSLSGAFSVSPDASDTGKTFNYIFIE